MVTITCILQLQGFPPSKFVRLIGAIGLYYFAYFWGEFYISDVEIRRL